MKKLTYILSLAFLVLITVQNAGAVNYGYRMVTLNQVFTISAGETVQVEDYPVTLTFESYPAFSCLAIDVCPNNGLFRFNYPTGSNVVTFYENVPQTYRGATMTVLSMVNGVATVFGTATELPHHAGTNVQSTDGTIWTITDIYTRRPYTSAAAFESYSFSNFAQVVPANNADMALPTGKFIPPQDGRILCSDRGIDYGTCYLISNGTKQGFVSEVVFRKLGFTFERALYGDVSWLETGPLIEDASAAHRAGTLVNRGGTIVLVYGEGSIACGINGIPNMDIFNSWGFSLEDVVPANQSDYNAFPTVVYNLSTREPGWFSY